MRLYVFACVCMCAHVYGDLIPSLDADVGTYVSVCIYVCVAEASCRTGRALMRPHHRALMRPHHR